LLSYGVHLEISSNFDNLNIAFSSDLGLSCRLTTKYYGQGWYFMIYKDQQDNELFKLAIQGIESGVNDIKRDDLIWGLLKVGGSLFLAHCLDVKNRETPVLPPPPPPQQPQPIQWLILPNGLLMPDPLLLPPIPFTQLAAPVFKSVSALKTPQPETHSTGPMSSKPRTKSKKRFSSKRRQHLGLKLRKNN
jgi:hypothetical protein